MAVKTKLRDNANPPQVFGDITMAAPSSSSSSSFPHYWRHYIHYQQQFSKLCPSSSPSHGINSEVSDPFLCQLNSLTFDNKEDEVFYLGLKSREMKLVYQNYAHKYSSNAEFGHAVLKQRHLIIDWIVNVGWVRYETTFLAVSLFDSFLEKGFFPCSRHMQLLGIACLMVASRIEENREENEMMEQSRFHMEDNTYYLSDVIGMEWLVLDVLNFRCYVPTVYNFLCLYIKAVNANPELERLVTKLALITLLDHGRLCYAPSTVAAALLVLASLHSDEESSCQHMLTIRDDVQHCVMSLGMWLQDYYHNHED